MTPSRENGAELVWKADMTPKEKTEFFAWKATVIRQCLSNLERATKAWCEWKPIEELRAEYEQVGARLEEVRKRSAAIHFQFLNPALGNELLGASGQSQEIRELQAEFNRSVKEATELAQRHVRLSLQIQEYKPIVDRFRDVVRAMEDLNACKKQLFEAIFEEVPVPRSLVAEETAKALETLTRKGILGEVKR